MSPKSNTLFTFTQKFDTIQLILNGGFWPRYCLEDIDWVDKDLFPFIAFPMVCFCDIPLSRITDHVGFYGCYGLGMSRDWVLKSRLNPVQYMVPDSMLMDKLKMLLSHANDIPDQSLSNSAKQTMRYIYAHTRPLSGTMKVNGKNKYKEFYQESEWRYVPSAREFVPFLSESKFNDDVVREAENDKTKLKSMLKFEFSDVRFIFVPTDKDIPAMLSFIESTLATVSEDERCLLQSRVISIERLIEDL